MPAVESSRQTIDARSRERRGVAARPPSDDRRADHGSPPSYKDEPRRPPRRDDPRFVVGAAADGLPIYNAQALRLVVAAPVLGAIGLGHTRDDRGEAGDA